MRFCSICGISEACTSLIRAEEKYICKGCSKILKFDLKHHREISRKEFLSFISKKDKILFAYSGGKDSTISLYLTKKIIDKEFPEKKIKVFTIDHGFKGDAVKKNIENVIKFLELEDDFILVDVSKETPEFLNGKGVGVAYLEKYFKKVLPCGNFCNRILDYYLLKEVRRYGERYVITGGDIPTLIRGNLTIFKERNGLLIVRAGWALEVNTLSDTLTKLPWRDPRVGGYDTDCLLPGIILYESFKGREEVEETEIYEKFPVVIEYLRSRIRFGIIPKQGFKIKLDYPNEYSRNIFYKIRDSLLSEGV